jgi:hypothetical protein
MARLRPHYRLRTLVILIAIIAIGISSTRWWMEGRRQILVRADYHQRMAGWLANLALAEEQSSAQHLRLATVALDSRRATKDFLEKWRTLEKKLGMENPNHEDSCIPGEAEAESYKRLADWKTRRARLSREHENWHRARARELRRMGIFNLAIEAERDRQYDLRKTQEDRKLDSVLFPHFIAATNQLASIEDHWADFYELMVKDVARGPYLVRCALGARSQYFLSGAKLYRQSAEYHRMTVNGYRQDLKSLPIEGP